MKRLVGRRPLGLGSSVPSQGKNCEVEPLLSFCHSACSVSEVAALGRQVSEGRDQAAVVRHEVHLRVRRALERDQPVQPLPVLRQRAGQVELELLAAVAAVLQADFARWVSACGLLLTMLITPAAVPAPNSMPEGPRSTSRRSRV